jgi:hypothetical protein
MTWSPDLVQSGTWSGDHTCSYLHRQTQFPNVVESSIEQEVRQGLHGSLNMLKSHCIHRIRSIVHKKVQESGVLRRESKVKIRCYVESKGHTEIRYVVAGWKMEGVVSK